MNFDLQRLWRQMAADKRKLGMMVALLGVAMLLWGRLLLKDVPRTANANPGAAVTRAASTTIGNSNGVETDNVPVDRPVVTVALQDEVVRDLFAFNKDFYLDPSEQGVTNVTAKSGDQTTDVSLQRQQAEAAIRVAAQNLVLKSTLLGAQPRAVINGLLLAPGDEVQGFRLTEVRSRAVTVTREGFEIVLEM